MSTPTDYKITKVIDDVGNTINDILTNRRTDQYLSGIVLLYSFMENVLTWLVYVKLLWDKSGKELRRKEVEAIKQFCNQQSFYSLQNIAYSINLIDWETFKRLDQIRKERNDIVHQMWLYKHRGNRLVLRKKLEKLARTANSLVGIFNKMVRKTGADDTYDLFLVRPKKGILV